MACLQKNVFGFLMFPLEAGSVDVSKIREGESGSL